MMRPPRRCASPSLAVYLNTPSLALGFGSSFSKTPSKHSTLGTHQFHVLPSRIRSYSIATSSPNLDLVSTRATTPPGFHRPASLSTRPKISTASRRPYLRLQRTFSSQSHHAAAMSSQLIPSNPSDVMVIRHVTPNIATFSVPFARVGRIKIGGRGTLVKLSSGALAVFSPVALTDATKAKVTEMGGDVRYIIALDYEHHIFISEWAKEYPAAKIIGPEGLPEKRAKQNDPKIGKEEFAVVFTKANKGAIHISEEFDTDFEYEYVDAHANLEIVFFYKPDRVLIEADLLFNLPATEQYSKVPEAEKPADGFIGRLFSGLQDAQGDARWIKRFNWYMVKNRESFNESIQRIDKWDFVSLIPCHGDVMEEDAKATFRKVFEWHLKGSKH